MNSLRKKVILCGTIGAIGALLTILADVAYNVWGGNQLGNTLYISFLGLFSFPLWWGGIWVIYQGLKPAGVMWSLVPCLLFACYTATVNVFYHSCYPFWAALKGSQAVVTGDSLVLVNNMMGDIRKYTSVMNNIDRIMKVMICFWIALAILIRKTHLPKWIVVLIPICPTVAVMLIDKFINGTMDVVEPYLACVPMFLLFVVITVILSKKFKNGECLHE